MGEAGSKEQRYMLGNFGKAAVFMSCRRREVRLPRAHPTGGMFPVNVGHPCEKTRITLRGMAFLKRKIIKGGWQ